MPAVVMAAPAMPTVVMAPTAMPAEVMAASATAAPAMTTAVAVSATHFGHEAVGTALNGGGDAGGVQRERLRGHTGCDDRQQSCDREQTKKFLHTYLPLE